MNSRGEGHVTNTSTRGQSAVLSLVLLIGMVAAISVGILLVAGDMMTDTEQRAETERIEQSFVKLSQQMATVAADGDAPRSMTFDAGERGAIVKTNTAYINISGNGVDESIRVGAIEYEGDDGTRIAYQAGGVFRETGTETQVVSEPPLEYDQSTHTFSFPVVKLNEETELSSGDVRFSRTNNNTAYTNSTYVEQSPIQINITSEYCVGWQTYFEEETDQINGKAVQETCSEGETGTLRVELGRQDIEEGTFENGVIVSSASGKTDKKGTDEVITERTEPSSSSIDRTINQMVSDMKDDDNVMDFDEVSETKDVESGAYFIESETISGERVFDLDDGNITLVVEDELVVDGDLQVENAEQSGNDHFLQIYVKDGMKIDGKACVDKCSTDDDDSRHLQVYGTSDTHFGVGTGGSYFEGIIYAPSGGESWDKENKYFEKETAQLVMQSKTNIDGSIVMSSIHVKTGGGSTSITYDESLETFSPEMNPNGYVFPPKLSYLNLAEYSIEVKNT